jgi:hypothetical protein
MRKIERYDRGSLLDQIRFLPSVDMPIELLEITSEPEKHGVSMKEAASRGGLFGAC